MSDHNHSRFFHRGAQTAFSFVPYLMAAGLVGAAGCHREYRRAVDDWYANASQASHAEPSSPLEAEALERLATLGPGAETLPLHDATLSVEPTYASAARLTCRGFTLQREPAEGAPSRRVACRDGDAWFLAPDLLEDGTADGPEDEP